MKTIENKIFLEFSKDKDGGHLHFIGEGSEMKLAVRANSLLKEIPLYDRYGNKINDFDTNAVDYYYDEGGFRVFIGRWVKGADDLSEGEARAVLKKTDGRDYEYVKWAREVLCLDDDD